METIARNGLRGLRINAVLRDEVLPDLNFLRDYTGLEELSIVTGEDYDFRFLSDMVWLKRLSLNAYLGTHPIDLSPLRNLSYLFVAWQKRIEGIEQCRNVRELCLSEFKEPDLSKIRSMRHLERLSIETGSIKTLSGLEAAQCLESVELGNCRYLQSIAALNGKKQLKELEIEACSKIADYEALTDLPSLEKLHLTNCKDIPSIRFISHFPALKKLWLIANTNVVDGDLAPAKDLEDPVIVHRKHYNMKIENPRDEAVVKRNREKIRRLKEEWLKRQRG